MPSIFSRIIAGELPARFVWSDELVVAFLSIAPMRPGHTLVVPRDEIDHWIDLDPDLAAHLFRVSQFVGQAQQVVFSPRRVGVMIVGDEVPHVHVHVVPIDHAGQLSFASADPNPAPEMMDDAMHRLRGQLHAMGHDQAPV